MKKILAIVLTFCLMIAVYTLGMFSITASAETGYTYGDYTYTITNGEATIIEYSNWSENVDLVIPSEVNGYTVTGLGGRAFGYHWNIKSIYIPKSITDIDNETPFYFCSSIESIIVEEGNPKYRSQSNCLIDIESEKLLLGCKNSIIPSDGTVTIIGRCAFSDCTGLINIDIPNTILEINSAAFGYCEKLQSIHIPQSVRYISDYNVFMHCDNLSSITVDINNEYYHSENNCLIETDSKTLISGCNTSIIPNDGSVTKIGGMYAFSGCTFTSFVIPDKVEVIELGAFNACYQLKEIVLSEGVKTIGSHPFRLTAIEKIVLPKSVQSIGDMVFADTPIKDIYYVGSETDRELITFDSDNSELLAANWHYNTCQSFEHIYTSECDVDCNKCDWVRSTNVLHKYDDKTDTECNNCYQVRQLEEIWIHSLPLKTTFLESKDELDITGGEILLCYDNDTTEVVDMTLDMILGFNNQMVGEQFLEVSFQGKTTYFMVSIIAKSLSSISVTTKPSKLTYTEGEAFNKSGMVVTAYYNNNTSGVVTDYTVSGYTSTPGIKTIIISYEDKTATFEVKVEALKQGWLLADNVWYYYIDNVKQTGWQYIDNHWYYLADNGAMATGWLNLGGTWYYMYEGGAMQTGWQYIGNVWYYMNESGAMTTGWQQIDGNWYFFSDSGAIQTGWLESNGKWYYLNSNGSMQIGWLTIEGNHYYLNNNGEMQIGWVTIDNDKYLFNNSGVCVEGANSFIIDISKWQGNIDWDKLSKTDIDGVILRISYGGTTTENNGNSKDTRFNEYLENLERLQIPYGVYHFNTATTIEMAEIQAQNVIGILKETGANPNLPVFVDIETGGGACDLNEIAKVYISKFIANGYKPGIYANENYWNKYLNSPQLNAYYRWIANYGKDNGFPSAYFSPKDGIENYMMWQYSSVGKLDGIDENTVDFNALYDWYLKPDGWREIAGKKYHNKNGVFTYGWLNENGNLYYMNSLGEMVIGWFEVDGIWYYSNCDGVVQTKWQLINGNWYYLSSNGAMQTGWLNLGSTWYYLADGGNMVTGWQNLGGTWYYMNEGGAMTTGWQNLGGTWYYMNEGGAMTTGWINLGGTWYYMNEGGAMQTGWQYIGNVWYYFYDSGAMAANCWIGGYWINAGGVWEG